MIGSCIENNINDGDQIQYCLDSRIIKKFDLK